MFAEFLLIGKVLQYSPPHTYDAFLAPPIPPHTYDEYVSTGGEKLLSINIYTSSIVPLLLVTLVLAWFTRPQVPASQIPEGFRSFRFKFLCVWTFVIAADWLQGPYVYALYESYGYSPDEISKLFVGGFAASMVFGTFVGALADSWGRKRCAMLYCVLYGASCVTKHWNVYWILMIGRILGGIATSLLFSTFECWLVSECNERHNFGFGLLRYLFSLMFFVQYVVAIFCGFASQAAADMMPMQRLKGYSSIWYGGYCCPFDLSLLALVMALPLIANTWDENYGSSTDIQSVKKSFYLTCREFTTSWRVIMIGVVVATFEGSMYAFVLMWTPSLQPEGVAAPPHGTIFSLFMMACVCGSSVFSLFTPGTNATKIAMTACLGALLSFLAVSFVVGYSHYYAVSTVFFAFIAFEACVGVYFPAMGTLKSQVVSEEARAGVYNAFRIPLNMVVCGICLTSLSLQSAFQMSTLLLGMAVVSLMAIYVSQTSPKVQ